MQYMILTVQDKFKVDGETTLDSHDKGINILSYNHGVSMPMASDASANGRPTGRSNHMNFTLTKYLDKATPKLNEACVKGVNLGKVTLEVLRTGNATFTTIKYTLGDAYVTSVTVGGGGAGLPVETVNIQYTGIKWEYNVQGEDGSNEGTVPANWNLETNKDDYSG